jgi:hypothetical protein
MPQDIMLVSIYMGAHVPKRGAEINLLTGISGPKTD